MPDKYRDEGRHRRFEKAECPQRVLVKSGWRIERFPDPRELPPLRVRIKRLADRAAEPDANPRDRMRVIERGAENKGARQADDADQAQCRADAKPRHCPEIGNDLGDPPLPQLPGEAALAGAALQAFQHRAQRVNEIEQGGGLMADLVKQRGSDSCANQRSRGTRTIATGFSPPPGSRVRARRMAAPTPRSR